MRLKIFLTFLLFLMAIGYRLVTPPLAQAHCPLCVAGAAAGITLTRWVGIDDSITGVWIAAFLGSMSFWFYSWLISKKINFVEKYKLAIKPFIYLAVFAATLWSFYKFQLIIRMSQIWGLDKLTFGMVAGGTLFYLIDLVKLKHYFNYQKIVIGLGSMVVLSLFIYILINFYI